MIWRRHLIGAGALALVWSAAAKGQFNNPNRAAQTSDFQNTTYTATWADVDGVAPRIGRMRDRVFFGAATATNDNRITGAVQPNWGAYANWAPRDSDVVSMSSRGMFALTGMSRSSDKAGVSPAPSTCGVGGFVVNDLAAAFGRAGYWESQRESGAGGTVGHEIVVKNKGDNQTATAYSNNGGGTYGIWLVAGGDPSYGGTPANPCDTSVHVKPGAGGPGAAYKWNKGVIFDANSITGTDGTDGDSGTGIAIELAKQHQIQWLRPNGSVGAFLKSIVTNAGAGGGIRFEAAQTFLTDSGGVISMGVTLLSNAVNYPLFQSAAAGNAVELQAIGSDTDVAIRLFPKGSAGVRYKTDVVVQAGSTSVSAASSGRLFQNVGASALVTITLPAVANGLVYEGVVLDADGLKFLASGANVIRNGAAVSGAGGFVSSTTIGSAIKLVGVNSTDWVITSITGTWTLT